MAWGYFSARNCIEKRVVKETSAKTRRVSEHITAEVDTRKDWGRSGVSEGKRQEMITTYLLALGGLF
jgi:hypothetical protein